MCDLDVQIKWIAVDEDVHRAQNTELFDATFDVPKADLWDNICQWLALSVRR